MNSKELRDRISNYKQGDTIDKEVVAALQEVIATAYNSNFERIPKGDPDQVKEEATARVFEYLHTFNPEYMPSTWIATIVKNLINSSRRRWIGTRDKDGNFRHSARNKAGLFSLEGMERNQYGDYYAKFTTAVASPYKATEQKNFDRIIPIPLIIGAYASRTNPDKIKSAERVLCARSRGHKYKVIEEAQGIPEGTVKSSISKGKQKFSILVKNPDRMLEYTKKRGTRIIKEAVMDGTSYKTKHVSRSRNAKRTSV